MRLSFYFADTCVPIQIPAFAVDYGFADRSWHNDAGARAELELTVSPHDHKPYKLVLWVNAEKVQDREGPEYDRFLLLLCPDTEAIDEEQGIRLYAGEDEEQCAVQVQAFLRLWFSR